MCLDGLSDLWKCADCDFMAHFARRMALGWHSAPVPLSACLKSLAPRASLLHTPSAMNFRKNFSFAMPWALGVVSWLSCATPPAYGGSWTYKLVEGSCLVDDCP